VGVDL